jgi:hypothetical protein
MVRNHGIVITKLVMTFVKLSATGKYAVHAGSKGLHDKNRVDSAGTHDSDRPNVWRVLKTGNACGIRRRIAAPIAEKA